MTQWFIFAYGDCPSVTYVFDFNAPLANGKSRKVRLPIGFPQGDNLSGFLFSITIRYIFRKLVVKYAALSVQFGFSTNSWKQNRAVCRVCKGRRFQGRKAC